MTGTVPGPDPDQILSAYDVNGAYGAPTGWRDDEYHQLLARGRAVVAQQGRKMIYDRCQQILQEACPAFTLNERPILCGGSPSVQGFQVDTRQYTYFSSTWIRH